MTRSLSPNIIHGTQLDGWLLFFLVFHVMIKDKRSWKCQNEINMAALRHVVQGHKTCNKPAMVVCVLQKLTFRTCTALGDVVYQLKRKIR